MHWLTNYLSNRKQRVLLNGSSSTWLPIKSGVPQGSILGPLLFIIYVNDICKLVLSPGAKLLLFADDMLLYKPLAEPSDSTRFQADVNLVGDWVSDNYLSINASKTKFMFISRRRNCQQNSPSFYLGDTLIQSVSHFKYLGVWISDDLSWSKHVEVICCKAHRLLGYMFRTLSPHCDQASIISLYKSLILPILEYACVVWNPHLKQDQLLLESVQLFAMRLASHSWKSDSESLNQHFQLPSLSSRRAFFYANNLQVFKQHYLLSNSLLPTSVQLLSTSKVQLLSNFSPHPKPNLRVCHRRQLVIPYARTTAFLHSFFIRSARTWNSLPSDIVSCDTLSSFKLCIRSFYLY